MSPFLAGMSDIALITVALASASALGVLIGGFTLGGVGLGIGGVLFAGIAVGHAAKAMGVSFDPDTLGFIKEIGLIVFVYTIGVQVGPGFFGSLQRAGAKLNALAAFVVLAGVATTVIIQQSSGIDPAILGGVMSGAVTNTPGLGAVVQALRDGGASPEAATAPSLGYAVAYPFGIVGILLTILGLRAVFRVDLDAEARRFDAERGAGDPSLATLNVAIVNPRLDGCPLSRVPGLADGGATASRMKRDGVLALPTPETVLRVGDVLHLVGPPAALDRMRLILGDVVETSLSTADTNLGWERIVATQTANLGESLRKLALEERHGVRISHVARGGVEIVPHGALTLQFGDMLNVVGPEEGRRAVKAALGDERRRLQEVDFAAVFFGIALGVLLGSIPIAVPGLPAPLKLGLAGGPLIAAIVLSRLGSWGRLVWFMPSTANHALREFGIILFLAAVGIGAGARFLEALVSGDGLVWMGYGAVITLVPLISAALIGRLLLRLDHLTLSGLLAGACTDPPALAFASRQHASPAASMAYATVYPLVMFLRIMAAQLLVITLV